ncbi:hypothetical protein HMPREF1861_02013 [Corynebacterium kroppenstedtii]|nr:hypothetical protein HMPREF1861_02013 [Corynebacterium kroppenstedtii]
MRINSLLVSRCYVLHRLCISSSHIFFLVSSPILGVKLKVNS